MQRIRSVNTLEISSICNNSCEYCPVPHQSRYRPTGFMDEATFKQALTWVKHFAEQGTQKELNLYGLGEPTIHPQVIQYVAWARDVLPAGAPLQLTTNGNTMTEELAWKLIDAGMTNITVSAHKAKPAAQAIRILGKIGVLRAVDYSWILQPHDWAGQIDWLKSQVKYKCGWLGDGDVAILSDGRVTRCCIDAYAQGIYCTVFEDPDVIEVSPFNLCIDCHHIIPKDMQPLLIGDIFQHKSYVKKASAQGIPLAGEGDSCWRELAGAPTLKK